MKVATGIYKTAYRYDVRACAQGVTRFASFPLDTKLAAMKHWQEDQRAALRRTKPTLAKGTLAADIVTYLARPEVKAMASRHQREVMLKFWGDRLGHKRRHNITPADIKDGLDAIAHLAPATRNKFRMVLLSLWTALDGPSAGCPARDVPKAKEGKSPVRSLSPEALADILGRLHYPANKTTARILVIAATGLPPSLLKGITPDMVDLARATVTVPPRKKGGGMAGRVLPITAQAVEAFKVWLSVRAYEGFDGSTLRYAFKAAARKAGYPSARLYDLRHTFLTRVAREFGIQAAMGLGIHASISTTQRYVNGAVQPLMQQAITALNNTASLHGLAEPSSTMGKTPTNTLH